MTAGSTDSLVGRLIDGRYQVRSRIARGGMATVYLATDLRLERKVAIKVMHGHLSDDSKFRDRFIQEARSAARLAHPNVVNVFDQGQDSDMAYLVMEYLPGITLRDLLQEHGRLTTDQTLDILEAVLAGLSAAHKAGIVHRDLKPENVLLADDGRIKIGDFGLARAASANTATGAALLGTIAYLSPELVTRGIADTRSDIYAVGIMTYEMLTGKQPFVGEQPMQIAYQHANDTVPSPSTENPRVPAELDELVLWATAREPDERPRDARALLNEAIAVRSQLDAEAYNAPTVAQRTMVMPPAAAPPPRGDTSETQILAPTRRKAAPAMSSAVDELATRSRKRRGRGWWLAAVIVVLLALAGGAGWYFGDGPGANAAVPRVAGDTLTAATTALTNAGFHPLTTTTSRFDPDNATGSVSGTSPAIGRSVAKGAKVTIILSKGPAQLSIPVLAGLPETQAKAAIRSAKFLVGSPTIRQFDPKATKGTVIDYDGTGGTSLLKQTTYSQKRPITLIVSAGPLPDVANLSVTAAEAKLKKAGLAVSEAGSEAYNATIPVGNVVSIDPQTNAAGVARLFRVGDTSPVLLITSRGPEMVQVPNVIGLTWAKAKPILTAGGFALSYPSLADLGPNTARVQSVTPGYPTSQPKGTKLTITFHF
ncbi:MAG TPA: Stk1 family PASTA domain-containing Ser/Thr kinase [Galbitalea sp.]|nr:Stk1 family PASTA domain-containing Ser/Thr kinase [Galbitalea sp.]